MTKSPHRRKGKVKMANTPKRICGWPKKSRGNAPCEQPAGNGTDHPGEGPCRFHERAALEKQARSAKPIKVDPHEAVLAAMRSVAGKFALVSIEVSKLNVDELIGQTTGELHPWLRWQRQLELDLTHHAKTAAAIGVDERQIRLAEQQTLMMGQFVKAVLDRIELTEAQRKLVGPAIREELAVVSGNGKELT